MQRDRNTPARVLAVLALVGALLATVVIVAGSVGGDGNGHGHHGRHANHHAKHKKSGKGKQVKTPATYVVQSGDTLTAIAAKTGVSVAEIQQLNPSIDPQILVEGQRLKLR
jgi:LysM repeat protein